MVAAPTDLSLTETDDLKESGRVRVKAQRLVVNGVLDEEACKTSLQSVDAAQNLARDSLA